MTVRLLVDWKDYSNGRLYKVGNLLTTDSYTESGLISSGLASSNLVGGTSYVDPVPAESYDEAVTGGQKGNLVVTTTNPLTGRSEVLAGEVAIFSKSSAKKQVVMGWEGVTIGSTTAGWTCVKSSEKTIDGLQTLKLTAVAGAADAGVVVLTFPATCFGYAKRLGFGICPTDPYISGDGSQVVQAWLNTTAGGHRMQCVVNASHVSGDFDFRWSYIGVDGENVVAGQSKWPYLAFDGVVSISLIVNKRAGMALDPIYISPIISDPVTGVEPSIITLFMDGGYAAQYSAAKMLKSRNMVASLATVVPRIGSGGSYLTLSQLKEMYADGHEIICHTGSGAEVGWNDTGKYPDGNEYALVKADIQAFQSWADANGFSVGRNYAVVGFTNGLDSTQTLTRRNNISQALRDSGIVKIRQLGGWGGPYYGDSFSPSLTTPMTSMLDAEQSVATITGIIDNIIARPGGWHGLTMHNVVAGGATSNTITMDTFRQVVDYMDTKVAAGQLRVMPFSKAMESYRY